MCVNRQTELCVCERSGMMPESLGGELCVFPEVQSSGSTICRAVLHQQRGETCVWGVHDDVGAGECKSNLFF